MESVPQSRRHNNQEKPANWMNTFGSPKIIYLTAGAAGMFCGSCMHDNALAKALAAEGWNIQLVPTYTPIRTDETNVSVDQVFFGGINVYLQQKLPVLRYLPSVFDRFLDNPRLIRRVTANAMDTDPKLLGQLALSMLKGLQGNQRKEVKRICRWIQKEEPEILIFTNILIGGCIPYLKKMSAAPILVTLQGDDVFLDSLDESFKSKCMTQIRKIAKWVDGFVVHSHFFRDYMSEYFEIDREKIFVTPLGIDVADYEVFATNSDSQEKRETRNIGYLAKLAPQKGLHHLVEAFIDLKKQPHNNDVKLKIAGWLGPENRDYAETQFNLMNEAGLQQDFEYLGVVNRKEKLTMLRTIDLLSVPTEFLEPKGLYVLEALAAGVPVVEPNHACFPELIAQTQGGLLFEYGDKAQFVAQLQKLLDAPQMRSELGQAGQRFVHSHRNSNSMAEETGELIRRMLNIEQSQKLTTFYILAPAPLPICEGTLIRFLIGLG